MSSCRRSVLTREEEVWWVYSLTDFGSHLEATLLSIWVHLVLMRLWCIIRHLLHQSSTKCQDQLQVPPLLLYPSWSEWHLWEIAKNANIYFATSEHTGKNIRWLERSCFTIEENTQSKIRLFANSIRVKIFKP